MYSNEVSARTESDRGPPGCTQKRNPISGVASGAANTVCMSAPPHEVQFWDGGSISLTTYLFPWYKSRVSSFICLIRHLCVFVIFGGFVTSARCFL